MVFPGVVLEAALEEEAEAVGKMKIRIKKRKKDKDYLFYGAVLLLLVFFLVIGLTPGKSKQNRVCFENHCFKVELATTVQEQARGLMFREGLETNRGMLFVFKQENKYGFWMKNMLFPLDIIWINENQEIVFMARNMRPCSETCRTILPDKKAKYVLEVNAGTIEKLDINLRDKLEFYINL